MYIEAFGRRETREIWMISEIKQFFRFVFDENVIKSV